MAKKRANGDGNIRKRADGRWKGRYTAGYNKNKHSLRGFLSASGTMLILYQTKSTTTALSSPYNKSVDCNNHLNFAELTKSQFTAQIKIKLGILLTAVA